MSFTAFRHGLAQRAQTEKRKNNSNNPKISFWFSQEHQRFGGSVVQRAVEAEGQWAPAGCRVDPLCLCAPRMGQGAGIWRGCLAWQRVPGHVGKVGGHGMSCRVLPVRVPGRCCIRGFTHLPPAPAVVFCAAPARDEAGLGATFIHPNKKPQRAPKCSSTAPFSWH